MLHFQWVQTSLYHLTTAILPEEIAFSTSVCDWLDCTMVFYVFTNDITVSTLDVFFTHMTVRERNVHCSHRRREK